jgi:predicted dehydrogenase
VHDSYDALLTDPTVEIVYVALHNSAHLEWSTRALLSGKHVVCEKPLGLTTEEVLVMTRIARAQERLLVEACWNRWHPRTRLLEQILQNGDLGTIRSVQATFVGRPPHPGNFRLDPQLGGGALHDVGCYAVAATLLAFNWQHPTVVCAHQRTAEGGVDVTTSAQLRFPTGSASIRTGLTGEGIETLVIVGDAGEAELERPAFTAGSATARLSWHTATHGKRSIDFPPVNPYRLMVDSVASAACGSNAFVVTLSESLAISETMDSIRGATHCD